MTRAQFFASLIAIPLVDKIEQQNKKRIGEALFKLGKAIGARIRALKPNKDVICMSGKLKASGRDLQL